MAPGSARMLTGYLSGCIDYDKDTFQCPVTPRRPLHTDRGDLYFQDQQAAFAGQGIFTAVVGGGER